MKAKIDIYLADLDIVSSLLVVLVEHYNELPVEVQDEVEKFVQRKASKLDS